MLRQREARLGGRRFDLAFFSYLDQFVDQGLTRWDVGRHLGRTFSGLRFRVGHMRVPQRYAWLRAGPLDPDHVLTSRLCRGFAVLDEGVASSLSAKLHGKRVFVFPDVAYCDDPAGGDGVGEEVRRAAGGRVSSGCSAAWTGARGLRSSWGLP